MPESNLANVIARLRWCVNGTSWLSINPEEARLLIEELDRLYSRWTVSTGTIDVKLTTYPTPPPRKHPLEPYIGDPGDEHGN